MENKNNVIADNRIVYVDPNNIRGDVNGTQLTPDYTNFSIWCNLVVERASRLKNQANGVSYDELYVVSWDMSKQNDNLNVSFLQGKDAERYNFLTTDYTNIDFNEIKNRNIIEGLQIESVNVGFTNYQTPQVTIKFIDIRGGGFFGREEATHNEYGKLSNLETDKNTSKFDNFFSCFVSFPYPRFRLQVKGFYGKPVTFQLTCTNFSGRFNATTGNFEITVQFIGYEYGVLGDIPFDLLLCAPLTEEGSEYWDEHVRNMDKNGWALDKYKTEAPVKLLDFYYNISQELQNIKTEDDVKLIADDSMDAAMSGLTEQIKELGEIKICTNELKDLIKKAFKPYYITEYSNDDENTIIIYNPKEIYENTNNLKDFKEKYIELIKKWESYHKKYEPSGCDGIKTWYDNVVSQHTLENNITFTNFMKHRCTDGDKKNKDSHINVIEALNSSNNLVSKILNSPTSCIDFRINKLFDSNEDYIITKGVSEKIYNDLSTRNWAIYGEDLGSNISFAGYVLAIQLGENIDKKISDLKNNYNEYTNKVNDFEPRKISDIVGFTPYVGRYFKVVMCHLETLVHLFYKCVDSIYDDINENEKRLPAKLGIVSLDNETDVPSNIYKQVPPFPAVYKKYTTEEEKDKALNNGKNIVANAWIGDFKGTTDWREEKLVDDLAKAAKRINDMRKEQSELGVMPAKMVNNSVFPIDYIFGIPQYAYTSIDGLMFYVALRAEIQLDFMSGGNAYKADPYKLKDWSYSFGILDGYQYATNCVNKMFLSELSNINNFTEKIYNSTVYNDKFIQEQPERYFYEFVKNYKGRHPVFIEDGDKVTYNYMINKAKKSIFIPLTNFKTFNSKNGFAEHFDYYNGIDFEPQESNSNDFLVGNPSSANEYKNTPHFSVITDEAKVRNIKTVYNDFKNGDSQIYNKPSSYYSGVVNQFSNVSDGDIEKYYMTNSESFFESYSSKKIEEGIDFKTDTEGWNLANKLINIYF